MVVFIQSHRPEEATPDSYDKSNQALYISTFKDISHIKIFNSDEFVRNQLKCGETNSLGLIPRTYVAA